MKYIKRYLKYIKENIDTLSSMLHDVIKYLNMSDDKHYDEISEFFNRNYPNILNDWLAYYSEIVYDDENDESLPYPEDLITLYKVYPKEYIEYCKFLEDISENAIKGNNPYELDMNLLPPYVYISYEDTLYDTWLVHFTSEINNVHNIIKKKYFLGVGHIDNLAFTVTSENSTPHGYCFAFDINDAFYNFDDSKNSYKYGNVGIFFKANCVKIYHKGDEELQCIFIGDSVSNMIGFYEKNGTYYTLDDKISNTDFYNFIEDVTM